MYQYYSFIPFKNYFLYELAILLDEFYNLLDEFMKCLIVDDDLLICNLLEHFCSKLEDITSVTITTSGFESINLIHGNAFDVIFLDYNLPDITGKEIVEIIPSSTAVVMVTSNKDFASDSYNYDWIIDYLVKPIDFTRFFKAFQKAKSYVAKLTQQEDRIFVKDGSTLVKIDLKDVLYFKSEANYIAIIFENKKILTLMTLKDLQQKLPYFFQKVHRSYIVNLNKIQSINTNAITIEKDHIPISSRYEKELLNKINLLN